MPRIVGREGTAAIEG